MDHSSEHRIRELEAEVARLRRSLEQALSGDEAGSVAHSAAFLDAVLDAAGALIVLLDREGRIVRFNRASEEVSGYDEDEVLGRTFWFLLPEEDVPPVTDRFDSIWERGAPNRGENYWIRKDGEPRLIAWSNTTLKDSAGRVEYVIAIGIDITEQRAAEEKLKLYKRVFQASRDGISIMDHTGKLVDINPANLESISRSTSSWFDEEGRLDRDNPDVQRIGRELDEEGGFRGDFGWTMKDGNHVHVDLSVTPIYGDDGKPQYFVTIGRDITELRSLVEDLEDMNRDLKTAQAQLVQSEKMASLGMLVAGIAHEINTPIGAVSSMHQTLMKAVERLRDSVQEVYGSDELESKRIRSMLRVIDDANGVIRGGTDRVINIVRRLKSFARLDEAELKDCDLQEGLEDTLTLVHHEIKHTITVEKDYGELPRLWCYPGQLNQVFLNLIINAKQAIESVRDKGTITVRTRADKGWVEVSIADDGAGIRPEHLSRIFDPGFTTKGVGVGAGLGLSICYRIVTDHHGIIRADSEPGVGTTFTLRIPTDLKRRIDARKGESGQTGRPSPAERR